jgi:hypothetical protein
MSEPLAPAKPALRAVERTLLRRRAFLLDTRLRIEILALLLLIAAFVFWRARIGLAALAHERGPVAVAAAVLVLWAGLAAAGGVLAGSHYALSLRRGPAGPPWLVLPIPLQLVGAHLRWNSRLHAFWVSVPAIGVFVGAIGLVPVWWLPLLGGAFVWLLLEASRVGCIVGFQIALLSTSPRPGPPLLRLLAAAARTEPHSSSGRAARWRRLPAWLAIMARDVALCRRPTRTRRRLVPPLVLAAAATFGEFLISLCGEDPFPVIRTLPLGVGVLWVARATWAILFAGALVVAHALSARALEHRALVLFDEWTGLAVFTIAILAVHYGLTLFPRAEAAQRLYTLSLGLALAGSVMIPLMGWVVLLAGVIHSARRLPRWSRLEEST